MKPEKDFVSYGGYLKLKELLDLQKPRSVEAGKPAHDEMLFIVIHQVYELWFKQILHEIDSIMTMFKTDSLDEKNVGIAVSRTDRIREIQKVLIDQIRILETMTSLDFLDFRNYLVPASGFQSAQFRLVERKLGLQLPQRIKYNNSEYYKSLLEEDQKAVLQAEQEGSLFDQVEKWLERTPFVSFAGFDFLAEYKKTVSDMIKKEKEIVEANTLIGEEDKPRRLQMLEDEEKYFDSIFDENRHNELIKKGDRRLSYKATLAALFIHLYRDQPILHLPYKLLVNLLDMDELFTTWRYRHALMVLRMIGKKVGTGGSSGHEYLAQTAEKHKIFGDLFNLSTLMIPRSALPGLPADFEKTLGFYYSANHSK